MSYVFIVLLPVQGVGWGEKDTAWLSREEEKAFPDIVLLSWQSFRLLSFFQAVAEQASISVLLVGF
jgi:hypothetical protein